MSNAAPDLRLGLIGGNIAASSSPRLHRLAGVQAGLEVDYDLLVPDAIGKPFPQLLADCATQGYRGVNVTYPYKETAARLVRIEDPLVRAIASVNTVVFGDNGPEGFNTDYSGFIEAYRAVRGERPPGPTLLIGTGGVGRAIAFALAALGAEALHLVDRDTAKAQALAADLRQLAASIEIGAGTDASAARGMQGFVNCTPVGMIGHAGTPLPCAAMQGGSWAFDAVYTPKDTQFLGDAESQGLVVISGWELFFFQGLHAWAHFSGKSPDQERLRSALLPENDAAS